MLHNHDNSDERYHVVEEAINDAFLLMVKEKSFEKITVSDIVKKAGIVRSTFYNHYEGIPDLIVAIEDKTIQDIFDLMESFHPKNDEDICKTYFQTLCDYTKDNAFLAELLCSPRGGQVFTKMMTMFHQYVGGVTKEVTPSSQSKEEVSYLIAITIGASLGVLHKWTREKFKAPSEEVAMILTRTFLSGILPYITSAHQSVHPDE